MSYKAALCFIISYEHILNKEDIWKEWIETNKDIINVYFHYKNFYAIKSPWITKYTIPIDLVQTTSYFNVVPAYISVLSYAFHHDIKNQWFCLLTESCVPIISPTKFRELFFKNYQKTIMSVKPAYWNIDIHHRANLRFLSKKYWLANDPWFTLCRDHVQKSMLFIATHHSIYKQVNDGGLANESIFAIILKTFNELENNSKYINACSTIADWTRMSTPTSPYLFKDNSNENIQIITNLLVNNKYSLFLRKIDVNFPNLELKQLIYKDENDDILNNKDLAITTNTANKFIYTNNIWLYYLFKNGMIIFLLYLFYLLSYNEIF